MIVGGFPREANTEVEIAGVRTNFRMPDIVSAGIGAVADSILEDDSVTVGPDSVSHRLTEEARVFGGCTVKATDIAVAAGLLDLGDVAAVSDLSAATVRAAVDQISQRVAELVDRMRTSPEPLPVVTVGGGSALLPDALPGLDASHRPENFAVANAIGAAIAQIGGEVDQVFAIGADERETVIDEARQLAVDRAVAAGADAHTVRVVELDEVPLPYLPGNATRVRCKAVGDLRGVAR